MSCLVPGVQANPRTLYSPLVSGSSAVLISDLSGIPIGITNLTNPPGLQPGLYSIIVHSSSNGFSISDTIYWSGTAWSAGGNNANVGGNLQIYVNQPLQQVTINNTSGAIIPGGVNLIPLSIGKIAGMP
jgi:hypothetical protein